MNRYKSKHNSNPKTTQTYNNLQIKKFVYNKTLRVQYFLFLNSPNFALLLIKQTWSRNDQSILIIKPRSRKGDPTSLDTDTEVQANRLSRFTYAHDTQRRRIVKYTQSRRPSTLRLYRVSRCNRSRSAPRRSLSN